MCNLTVNRNTNHITFLFLYLFLWSIISNLPSSYVIFSYRLNNRKSISFIFILHKNVLCPWSISSRVCLVKRNSCWVRHYASFNHLLHSNPVKNRTLLFLFILAINQSVSNPCQNGGTFTNNDGCFTCTCADGWAGALCNEGKFIVIPISLSVYRIILLFFCFL